MHFSDMESARAFLRTFLADRANVLTLRHFLLQAGSRADITGLHDQQVVDLVAAEFVSGRFNLGELWRSKAGVGYSPPAEEEAEEGAAAPSEDPRYWIEIDFVDTARRPVPIRYDFTPPGGSVEQNQEAADGRIHKRDLGVGGTCVVVLHRIQEIRWDPVRVAVGAESTIKVQTVGYPDETEATIEVFRYHRETADDVLETLSGQVTGNMVEATWTPPTPEEPTGDLRYVAKVTIEGAWKKTKKPLLVAVPCLTNAHWSDQEVLVGDAVELVVETPGVPDGTEVAFTVYRERYTVDDDEVHTATAATSGEEATVPWSAPRSGDAAASEGEYYFTAEAEEMRAQSNMLWVEDPDAGPAAPPLSGREGVTQSEDVETWAECEFFEPDDDDSGSEAEADGSQSTGGGE
jgi:hypothetical protein